MVDDEGLFNPSSKSVPVPGSHCGVMPVMHHIASSECLALTRPSSDSIQVRQRQSTVLKTRFHEVRNKVESEVRVR